MTIRLLDERTIGKICAGEVVERPASVVKELVENAIDAGATRIRVSVGGGGLALLEVHDNGQGMSSDEIPMAFERHATSKLTAFEDLDRLGTLGFRGEALPSIGAVAHVTITSRQADDPAGVSLVSDYGGLGAIERVGTDFGTTVSVTDLFGNVPARRKFLKQPSTETSAIVRVVESYALAYPAIAIQLIVDGRKVVATSGSGDLIDAVVAVHGSDVGNAVLPIVPSDLPVPGADVTVSGWLAAPTVSRATRQHMLFFVNGRQVQNRPLSYALEDAYHSLLMVGRHPLAMIRIELDPAMVDINVHPTKAEVKFADERSVTRVLSRTAHATLSSMPSPPIPHISFGGGSPMIVQSTVPLTGTSWGTQLAEEVGSAPSTIIRTRSLPALRVLGQVAATYIIAEGPEGLYLIDQHAAHERVVYERYLSHLADKSVDSQPMLDPLVIELLPEQRAVLDRSIDELQDLGFEVEPFGEQAVMVRAIPTNAVGVDIAERLGLILGELADGGVGDSWLDSVAISVACHTSIRAGQALSLTEMRELVEQLEATEHPRACGHGRPTMLSLTQLELEKQFSRK